MVEVFSCKAVSRYEASATTNCTMFKQDEEPNNQYVVANVYDQRIYMYTKYIYTVICTALCGFFALVYVFLGPGVKE